MTPSSSKISLILTIAVVFLGHAQPKIVVRGGERYDLGKVFEGTTTERMLVVLNDGKDSLHIRNVTTSCHCTVTKVSNKEVAPGDSMSVSVAFNSSDLNGPVKRDVYIYSNDSTRSMVDVVFTAEVYTVLQVLPRYITFGEQRLGHADHRELTIRNSGSEPVAVTSFKSPDPQLSLSVDKRIVRPNDSLQLTVTLNPVKAGKLLGQIEVQTDSKIKPILRISYVGNVKRK